ncbi:hypothetical protein I4U23_005350 [Adineta vaga]|nr:hypothetical protein I4U23_005350 [Adineta vaga]
MSSLKNYFLTLNLFTSEFDKTEDETIEQRRWNIIGTRIYILLLVIILIGIAIGLSLVNHTIKVIIENPTKEQIDQLPIDAKCKCSQILIPYGTFTSVQVTFHEICSSDFITDRWINAINSGYNTTFFNGRDFRTYGSAEFQSLAGFCRLSKSYINQNIDSFYSNTLLSSEVLSEKILQSQTSSSIKQFQLISSNTFQNQLNLINNMIVGNGLNSALGTVYYYQIQLDDLDRFIVLFISITTTQEDGSTCSCLTDICNKTVSGIYNVFQAPLPTHSGDLLFRIPGISSGCLPVTSILASTLECFYDQICIDQLLSYFPTNDKNFQSLLINNQSIFNSKSTIQSIVNNLMIKNLTINISYEKYYSQCTPSSCIYFQNSHYDFKFIIKKLISLFASLILILELIIPFSIKFIQQLKDRTPKPKISLLIRLCQMKTLIKTKLIELNLFKHYPSSDRQIRYQRYATRYHLISMIILVFILTFYTLTIKTIQSKTIQKPTEFEFIQFEKEYSQTLSCPCSSISMLYSDFLTISPQYHQICSSDFISDKWFNYLYGSMTGRYYAYNRDYRFSALFQFKLLKILCKQSHSMINDALQLFFQRKFFSLQAMSQESFQIQIESVFQDWELTTIKTFLTTIQLFQAIIQGNQLTNIFNFGLDIELNSFLKMYPSIYSNCSCTYSPTCHELASIYKYDENNQEQIQIYTIPNFYTEKTMIDFEQTMPQLFINTLSLIRETIGANMIINNLLTNWKYVLYFYSDYYAQTVRAVPRTYNNCHCELSSKCVSSSRGMLAGCYPLEVLLQASIQCLYNQTCIDSSNSFQAINQSSLLSSRFSLNSTFESIINKLMIEEFLTEISYETYFNACAPSLCTYSYTHKYNLIEGITTLINLYGGLFIICRILSIIIVKNILCFKQRIHPETN